ncbi:MAG: hypothetical protein NTX49_04835, partial [Chlamydiae bacterium]|nr:hypothetical protein [Chlamydiota bacterium]
SAYGGSPAYDAVYRVSGSVGMGSSSYGGRAASGSAYGGSPAFEALYGDSRPSAAIIAQKAQILKQMDAVTVEMNQLLAKEAKAERRAAAMDRIRESNAAFEAREAQEQAEAKEAQKQARVEAKANIRARVDAKAQRQAEAEAQATERARAAAPAPARARAPAESYNPLNPFGATWY